jgi:hypothetical protein
LLVNQPLRNPVRNFSLLLLEHSSTVPMFPPLSLWLSFLLRPAGVARQAGIAAQKNS